MNREQRAERERERERDENTRGEATGSDFPTSDSAKQVGRKKSRPTEETDRTKRVGAGRRVNEQKGLDKSNGRMHRLDRDNEGPREAWSIPANLGRSSVTQLPDTKSPPSPRRIYFSPRAYAGRSHGDFANPLITKQFVCNLSPGLHRLSRLLRHFQRDPTTHTSHTRPNFHSSLLPPTQILFFLFLFAQPDTVYFYFRDSPIEYTAAPRVLLSTVAKSESTAMLFCPLRTFLIDRSVINSLIYLTEYDGAAREVLKYGSMRWYAMWLQVRSRSLTQLDALGSRMLDTGEHHMGGGPSQQQPHHLHHHYQPQQLQHHPQNVESNARLLVPAAPSAEGAHQNRTRQKLSRSQVRVSSKLINETINWMI